MVVHRRAAQPHGAGAFWQRRRQAGRCMRRTLKRAQTCQRPGPAAGLGPGAMGPELT